MRRSDDIKRGVGEGGRRVLDSGRTGGGSKIGIFLISFMDGSHDRVTK